MVLVPPLAVVDETLVELEADVLLLLLVAVVLTDPEVEAVVVEVVPVVAVVLIPATIGKLDMVDNICNRQ